MNAPYIWEADWSARYSSEHDLIQSLVRPETKLEQKLIAQPDWIEGALWGKPRHGHPEGRVIYHIREVLDNVEKITAHPQVRCQLRLITLLHDTFKFQEAQNLRVKHHAVYAREFASQFVRDKAVLDVIELHDEAYYSWRLRDTQPEISQSRLAALLQRLGNELDLFYWFFLCDTFTGDKTLEPVSWFGQLIGAKLPFLFGS